MAASERSASQSRKPNSSAPAVNPITTTTTTTTTGATVPATYNNAPFANTYDANQHTFAQNYNNQYLTQPDTLSDPSLLQAQDGQGQASYLNAYSQQSAQFDPNDASSFNGVDPSFLSNNGATQHLYSCCIGKYGQNYAQRSAYQEGFGNGQQPGMAYVDLPPLVQ